MQRAGLASSEPSGTVPFLKIHPHDPDERFVGTVPLPCLAFGSIPGTTSQGLCLVHLPDSQKSKQLLNNGDDNDPRPEDDDEDDDKPAQR